MIRYFQRSFQTRHVFARLLLSLCIVSLTGCANPLRSQPAANDLRGALLVWHNWPEPESQIIQQLLTDFMRIHPRVTIVNEYVPSAELDERFIAQMAAGLGPDLIIGAELPIINELVAQDLLLDLSTTSVITDMLLTQAVQALTVDDQLYGIPFAAYTNVLYFNRVFVEQPVSTLDELLEAAQSGVSVAIPTDFYHAYWGIRAFGGELVNADGQVTVDAGFTQWLEWLLNAQKEGLLLSPDYAELRQFFAEGNAAYFVGDSSELPHLQELLGKERVGVALLPHRVVDENEELDAAARIASRMASGAFLELEVMSISKISAQKKLGLAVIEFFVNQTHQREIAQADFGQIPINRMVRIDPRFSPAESILIRQSTNSVIMPLQHVAIEEMLLTVGSDIYNQVLEGILTPEDAAVLIRREINNQSQNNGS